MRLPSLLVAVLLAVAGAAAAAGPAAAGQYLPPSGKVWSGVTAGDPEAFGRRPAVVQQFVQWGDGKEWAFRRAASVPARVMLHLSTAKAQDEGGVITPGEIAKGEGDDELLSLNRRLAEHGEPVYLRLMAEMNNCRNAYAPLACSGRSRGREHGSRRFVAAWRRVTLVLRGGPVSRIDGRLRRLGQPPLRTDDETLPRPRLAMMWAPMTAGSPQVAALAPERFWPGRRYVDWVGTSFYSRYPNFRGLDRFYRRYASRHRRPFALAEWAMWGADDPAFARRLFAWVRDHRRTRMLQYNQGERRSGPFRLDRHPRAARVIRKALAGARYSALPPEVR